MVIEVDSLFTMRHFGTGSDPEGEIDDQGVPLPIMIMMMCSLQPVWYNVRSEVDVHLREAEALLDRMPARIVHLSQR